MQMLRHARCGVIRKHFLVMVDPWRGEALALSEWTKVECLGGVLDGHLKRQIQLIKIPPQFVSSIEKIKIKLHFFNLDIAPNGREELRLHNQNRAAARFETWEGPSSGMTQTSAAKRRSRSTPSWTEAAFLRAPGKQDCARCSSAKMKENEP